MHIQSRILEAGFGDISAALVACSIIISLKSLKSRAKFAYLCILSNVVSVPFVVFSPLRFPDGGGGGCCSRLLLPPPRILGTLYDGGRYRPCFIPRAYSVKLVIVAPCPLGMLGLKMWRLALSSRPKGRPHAVHTYSSLRISYVVLRLPFTLTPVLLLSS
jgi:hypothetical protein